MVYLNSIIALGILVVLLLSAMAWIVAMRRLSNGKPLLPYEPRRPVTWGLIDLGIAFLILFGTQSAAVGAVCYFYDIELGSSLDPSSLDPSSLAPILLAGTLASLTAAIFTLFFVMLRSRAKWSDLGFDFRSASRDAKTALLAFLMLAPSVYLIQMVLKMLQGMLTEEEELTTHPLIESVMENPNLSFFFITGLSAVVVAPVVEEFLFRVLLQGWLERVASHRGETSVLLLGGVEESSVDAILLEESNPDESLPNAPAEPADDNPYATPRSLELPVTGPQDEATAENVRPRKPPFWPILVSALLFAGMHYSHGPDPIALFVLAIGLGYLYQRTHRILPCILVHFLLNACSMGMLWLGLLFQ